MARITGRASSELRSIPGVQNVSANIGRAVLGDQVVDVNSAEFAVNVDTGANYDQTVAHIQKVINGYPGLFHVVQTYLKEKTKEVQTGSSSDIVVRIFGPDLKTLRSKAEEVRKTVAQVDGAVDVHTELQVEQPQLDVEVDLAKAQKYGLKPGDVRRAASTFVAGIDTGSLFQDQKVFQVIVWGTPQTRSSLTSIQNLLIDAPNGGQVRLGDVANVSIAPSPNLVQHETVSRRIDVSLNVRGRDPSAVASAIQQRLQGINFPLEYRAQVLGEYEQQQAAQSRLLGIGIAAALAIFLLLQTALGSWRLASVVFFTLPSALIGGVIAAFAGGSLISLVTLVGLLAIFSIATRNTVMLIRHYQHLQQYEREPFGPGLILRGAQERLVPILLTALLTGLALAPLVITGNIPGQEIAHPMAIIILSGLITSTVFSLFIVPPLYLGFGPQSLQPIGGEPVLFGLAPAQMTDGGSVPLALAPAQMTDGGSVPLALTPEQMIDGGSVPLALTPEQTTDGGSVPLALTPEQMTDGGSVSLAVAPEQTKGIPLDAIGILPDNVADKQLDDDIDTLSDGTSTSSVDRREPDATE